MPQLDTSTWPISILSMILALFIALQLKFSKFTYPPYPLEKSTKLLKYVIPWEKKWTKTYSLLSQSPH